MVDKWNCDHKKPDLYEKLSTGIPYDILSYLALLTCTHSNLNKHHKTGACAAESHQGCTRPAFISWSYTCSFHSSQAWAWKTIVSCFYQWLKVSQSYMKVVPGMLSGCTHLVLVLSQISLISNQSRMCSGSELSHSTAFKMSTCLWLYSFGQLS